jgi:hypothetical protein
MKEGEGVCMGMKCKKSTVYMKVGGCCMYEDEMQEILYSQKNMKPMGHIAHLSNLGLYRNIICISFPFAPFHSGAHDFNQLAFVLCQKAFK